MQLRGQLALFPDAVIDVTLAVNSVDEPPVVGGQETRMPMILALRADRVRERGEAMTCSGALWSMHSP